MTKQEYMAMSLPYELKIINDGNEIETISALGDSFQFQIRGGSFAYGWYGDTFDCKPILRPLSDLPRLITQKGYNNEEPFFPLYRLQKEDKAFTTDFIHAFGVEECKFSVIELLLKWHFDLFGGIESGEAVDVNSLDINPYK